MGAVPAADVQGLAVGGTPQIVGQGGIVYAFGRHDAADAKGGKRSARSRRCGSSNSSRKILTSFSSTSRYLPFTASPPRMTSDGNAING